MKKTLVIFLSLLLLLFVYLMAAAEEQETEWQPIYGQRGDLINGQPAVQFQPSKTLGGNLDPPTINTVLLNEDFEDTSWHDPDTPPPGWSIIDNGNEGQQFWYIQDWYKYYYSSWGDTTARFYYYPNTESTYDEWLISPEVILPEGASACSLTWNNYYSDAGAGKDTAYIKITTDGGTSWTDLAVWDTTHGSYTPGLENIDITSYAGNTVKIAFVLQCNTGNYSDANSWYVDKVDIWSDGSSLLFEDFNNWGPGGDNPPAGWTILDNGTPNPADTTWNENDWYDYSRWGSKTARIYYNSTYREWQDEWLISPSFSLTAAALCSLTVVEYYYHSSSSAPWGLDDHGYILLTTDDGATWNTVYDNDATKGSSSSKTTFGYDISAYAGSTCKVAFNFVNSPYGSDYWNIDDVRVSELVLPANDVASQAINSPIFGISGYNHNVSTQVVNAGLNTVTFDDSTKIYKLNKTTYFYEDFSDPQSWTGADPPVNTSGSWAVIDSGDGGDGWNDNDWHANYNWTWADTTAYVYGWPYENQNEWLITPALDFTGITGLRLTFRQSYSDLNSSDTAFVLGTNDDWTTVNTLAVYTSSQGSDSSPDRPDLDISAFADGQAGVKIAFKYVGYSGLSWNIDDVEIYKALSPTLDYASSETVSSLVSLESRAIDYTDTWDSPSAGDYQAITFTNLSGDEDLSNDTVAANLTVYEHYEYGGPDGGFYTWHSDKDGGTGDPYNWIDISTTGTPVTWDQESADNGYTYGIPLGFDFTYYDVDYDKIYLDKNGYVCFDSITSLYNYSNYEMPTTSGPENMIALLWDDLSDESGGTAYYYTNNADTFIVSYENWDFDTDLNQRIDMQLILSAADRNIKCQYKEVGPIIYTSHTIGIENAAGDIGLNFEYNGDPMGNIAMPGLAVTFKYNAPSVDAALASVDEPLDGVVVYNGTVVNPTVTVRNNGQNTETVDVTYIISDASTGDTVYNQTETTVSIPGLGGMQQHVFATPWPADTDGEYNVDAYVTLSGDVNPVNDAASSWFDVATHYSQEGPDDYGYYYIDNVTVSDEFDPPVFSYIDLTSSPTADTVGSGTSDYGGFAIGFPFKFYGTYYDTVYVNPYANLTFGMSSSYGTNECPIPDPGEQNYPRIMALWDYGYCNSSYDGVVLMETFGTSPDRYTVFQYHNWRRDGANLEFEIILHENGDMIFQYQDVNEIGNYGLGQDATIGIGNDSLGFALVYLCHDYDGSMNFPGNLLSDGLAIKLFKPVFGHDVGADEFVTPDGSGLVNEEFTPQVAYLNNGTNDETNIPVRLTIEPGGYNDVQMIAAIDSGLATVQAFAPFTPTAGGSYTLTAIAELGTDENPDNDTLIMKYTAYDQILDFESGDGGLIGSGEWQWGTPQVVGPAAAYSGVNCWGTNLTGNYGDDMLYSLEFELALGSSGPTVGMATWYETDDPWDGGNFGVSTDNGSTWNVVSPDCGYDGVAGSMHPLTGDSLFMGLLHNYWKVVNFDLSSYSGSTVLARFIFGSDTYTNYAGWYLDDLGLADCNIVTPEIDVAPLTLSGSAGPGGIDSSNTINVSNNGDGTLNFTVSTQMNSSIYGLQNPSGNNHLPVINDIIASENFDSSVLPAGWTIEDGNNDGITWVFNSTVPVCGHTSPGIGGDFMVVDDGCYGEWNNMSEGLVTCYYDCSANPNVFLQFSHEYDQYFMGDFGQVEVRNGSAGAWTVIAYYNADSSATEDISLAPYIGIGDSVQVRFYYNDGYDFARYWLIDDFEIYTGSVPWLQVDVAQATIPAGGPRVYIGITLDATDIDIGTYTGSVNITSNDQDEPVVSIPVTFEVGPLGRCCYDAGCADVTELACADLGGAWDSTMNCTDNPCGCDYVVGDVNGSDSYNGLDVTYGVAFLKGGSDPQCTECLMCPDWFYCGDINGSCSYNGLDITYGVAYLKGGPDLIPCADCPQAGSGITGSPHHPELPSVIKKNANTVIQKMDNQKQKTQKGLNSR